MPASLAGVLKAHLETLGLGVAVHRDRAPEDTEYPYITVREGISKTPERAFPAHDDPEKHISELVQVDVWQAKKNAAGRVENLELGDRVVAALHGVVLTDAPFPISDVTLVGSVRVPDPDANVVHEAITVRVKRTLVRS